VGEPASLIATVLSRRSEIGSYGCSFYQLLQAEFSAILLIPGM
jgi:hypothetical protein